MDKENFIPQRDTEVPEVKYLNRYVREKVCASEPRKWEDLGKELLKDKNIPALTARTHDMNEKQSCSEMFKVWFETQHKPTWRQLIRALQNIGLDQLADNIENLLIQSPKQSKVQLIQAQNQDGDTEVPEEKYFNRYVREKVCASEPRKWEDLGKELLEDRNIPVLTVRTRDMNEKQSCSEVFKIWLETQRKPTWRQLIRALQNIGLDQLADNIENLLIQSPRQSKVQLVQAQNQDGGDCIERQFNDYIIIELRKEYREVVRKLLRIFKEKNIDIEELITILRFDDVRSVFSTDDVFSKITTVDELFKHISGYCNSIFDYQVLSDVVQTSECPEAIKELNDFSDLRKSSILAEIDLISGHGGFLNPDDFMPETCIFVIEYIGGKCTMDTKEMIENIVLQSFRLKHGTIQFKGVVAGSILFIYQISEAVKKYLLDYKFTEQDLAFLEGNKILSLEVDDINIMHSSQLNKIQNKQSSKVDDIWISCSSNPNKALGVISSNMLHVLGLLLSISGIFTFWISFQSFTHLFLLLFNCILYILFECVDASVRIELLFQMPWKCLKLRNVTQPYLLLMMLAIIIGLINVDSMWELYMKFLNRVSSHPEYGWVVACLLWLTISVAMSQAILLAICIPVQAIIIPLLECNRNIHNINLRSHITLTINLWLLVHFVYLCINYSYYNAYALCYRFFCTGWMVVYCYPDQTYNTYNWFKRWLSDWIRPFCDWIRPFWPWDLTTLKILTFLLLWFLSWVLIVIMPRLLPLGFISWDDTPAILPTPSLLQFLSWDLTPVIMPLLYFLSWVVAMIILGILLHLFLNWVHTTVIIPTLSLLQFLALTTVIILKLLLVTLRKMLRTPRKILKLS